jgi:hypothetical protein
VTGLAIVEGGRYILSCGGAPTGDAWGPSGPHQRLRLLSAADGREVASALLPCAAECLLVIGSSVLVGLTDGGVRVTPWSSTGFGGASETVRAGFAPIVAMDCAEAEDAICVVSADGAVRHYVFDSSAHS